MSESRRVDPGPDVVHRRLGEETVLVHLATNEIYSLNRTGSRFWELLLEGLDSEQIRRQLLAEFDVDSTQLDNEMGALIASLLANGLVSERPA